MDRKAIFQNDTVISHLDANGKEVYRYEKWQEYGYLTFHKYTDSTSYTEASEEEKDEAELALNKAATIDDILANATLRNAIREYQRAGFEYKFLASVKNRRGMITMYPELFFYKDLNLFERLGNFFVNLISFETIWDVQDEALTNRYIRLEWDRSSNMPAIVGNGTTHKYLLYFDDKFPFIHQNFVHIRLGLSGNLYQGRDVVDYMKSYTDGSIKREVILPKDYDNPDAETQLSIYDFHSVTYRSNPTPSVEDKLYFPETERYTVIQNSYDAGLSRIGTSFVIGIIATFFAYLFGLPIGIWMAQRKDKLVDKLGNLYIIFIMAVPSLAYIFIFSSIGSQLFGLPTKYANGVGVLKYILPIVSLSLPSIGGLMKWMRRYMIDQQNSDYVKFARSQGLSEGEIFLKHISRNAYIFLIHSLPADIISALVGAIITERVYGVPGVGNMLMSAITVHDNAIIVGVTVFYTTLTILSLILGDLLLAKYDPRISLSGGKN